MSAVASARVPAFSSLQHASPSSTHNLHFDSSLSPSLPSSLKLSSLNLCLVSLTYETRSRKTFAEAKASSISVHSQEEELGYGFDGSQGRHFSSRKRSATRRSFREESFPGTRVSGAHNHCVLSQTCQKQAKSKAEPFHVHQARGSTTGIRQLPISRLSSNAVADASSWGIEDADVAPPNPDREALLSYEGWRENESEHSQQLGRKETAQRGAMFISKLEEVLSNMKKTNEFSGESDRALNQADPTVTNAAQGFQTATKAEEDLGHSPFLEMGETRSRKSVDSGVCVSAAADADKMTPSDGNEGFPLRNNRKIVHNECGDDGRSLLKKKNVLVVDDKARVTSFNLFSSSPSVPWEADRKHASAFKPRIPIIGRREKASPFAQRRVFTSVSGGYGGSSFSHSIVKSRVDSSSNLDISHGTVRVAEFSRPMGDEQANLCLQGRLDNVSKDGHLTMHRDFKMGEEEQVESLEFKWNVLDADGENGEQIFQGRGRHGNQDAVISNKQNTTSDDTDNTLFAMHLSTKGKGTRECLLTTESRVSPKQHMFTWHDSGSEFDDDDILSVDADVVPPPEFHSSETFHCSKTGSISSNDLENNDGTPPDSQCRETSPLNNKQILSACTPHSKCSAFSAAECLGDMASSASGPGIQSNPASWQKHGLPDLPFHFEYSYSETPKGSIIGYRETPYPVFGHSKPSRKKRRVFNSFPKDKEGSRFVQGPGPYLGSQCLKAGKSREEIMGEPLTKEEIAYLVEKCACESRQLNLGRDGLTHNMLDLIHCHWKRRRVCKIKCKGVPTVDLDNVKFHLEDKTGGKVIHQAGGVLYLFRGRNYNYKDRPYIPLMVSKPVIPLYSKLIQPVPEGLKKEEARNLRVLGQKVQPICRLGNNGVYLNLVKDVRAAFKVDELVRIDCRALNPSDYKKIGAKLKELVPCVLLSFYKEHILLWKGQRESSAQGKDSLRRAVCMEPGQTEGDALTPSATAHQTTETTK